MTLLFLFKKRITECASSEFSKATFNSVQHEGIIQRNLYRLRKATTTILAAAMIFTSFGNVYSCATQQENVQQDNASKEPVDKTDKNGKVIFNSDEKTFTVNFYDFEDRKAIEGLSVIFLKTGESGLIFVNDPKNRYDPYTVSLNSVDTAQLPLKKGKISSALSKDYSTNVILNKNKNSCGLGDYQEITGAGLDELYEGYQKELHDPTYKSTLSDNFEVKRPNVKLQDLDSKIDEVIKDLAIELAAGNSKKITEEGLKKIAVLIISKIGLESEKKTMGILTIVYTLAEYCEDKELRDWKQFYRGLCYGEDAEFDIWKWKATDTEIKISEDIKPEWINNPMTSSPS